MNGALKRRIALLLSSPESLRAQHRRILEGEFDVLTFANYVAFRQGVTDRSQISGIVLDMKTFFSFAREEKAQFEAFFRGKVPMLEFNFQSAPIDTVAQQIFEKKWRQFASDATRRELAETRTHPRRPVYLQAEICRGASWREDGKIRAFTADLSRGGCFVVSTEDWRQNERVLVRLESFPEPIACRIAWHRNLGNTREQLPGFGIEFERINPNLAPRLLELLGPTEYV